jgi:hypothetical protein
LGLVKHGYNFNGKEKGKDTQWIGSHNVEETFTLAGRQLK